MSKSTIRETHDTFEKLIQEQKKVAKLLKQEKKLTEEAYSSSYSSLIRELETSPLIQDESQFAQLSNLIMQQQAGGDLVAIKQELINERSTLEDQLTEIESQHGSAQTIKDDLEGLAQRKQAAEESYAKTSDTVETLSDKLNDFWEHNLTNDYKITSDNLVKIHKSGFFDRLFNSDLRAAYKIVKNYDGSPLADADTYERFKEQAAKDLDEAESTKARHNQQGQIWQRHQELSSQKSEIQNIDNILAGRIAHALMDESFAQSVAEKVDSEITKDPLTIALKARSLQTLSTSLDEQIKTVDNTISSLEKPMSKLKKGKRHRPSKTIDVDAKDISKKVNGLSIYSTYKATSLAKSRKAVSTFYHQGDMMLMNNMMLFWMISDCQVDAAFANDSLGLTQDVATQLNIDTDTLVPDIAETLGNIDKIDLGDFNLSDLGNIDVANIDDFNVDVGNVDVGNFSVPDVSISTSDFGGGSSGFDGGF